MDIICARVTMRDTIAPMIPPLRNIEPINTVCSQLLASDRETKGFVVMLVEVDSLTARSLQMVVQTAASNHRLSRPIEESAQGWQQVRKPHFPKSRFRHGSSV